MSEDAKNVEDSKNSEPQNITDIELPDLGAFNEDKPYQLDIGSEAARGEEKKSEEKSGENKEEPEKPQEEFSETEKEALNLGWVPKSDFRGNHDLWEDAKHYIKDHQFIDKIRKGSKQNKHLKKTIDEMSEAIKNMAHRSEKHDLQEMEDAKRAAIEAGDVDAVQKIDKSIYEDRDHIITPQQNANKQGVHPDVEDFVAENKGWFNLDTPKNIEMQKFAISMDDHFEKNRPDLSMKDRMANVKEAVMKVYPNEFGRNEQQPTTPRVPLNRDYKSPYPKVEPGGGSQVPPPQKSTITYKDLPPNVKNMVNTVCAASPDLTREEYTQLLVKNGAVRYE